MQRTKQHRSNFHFPKLRCFDASCDLYKNFSLRIHVKCYFTLPSCCNLISAASDCHPSPSLPPPPPEPETVRRPNSQKRSAQKSSSLHKRSYQFGLCSHLASAANMLTPSWPHTTVPRSYQQQPGCTCSLYNLFSAHPGVQAYESFPLVAIC